LPGIARDHELGTGDIERIERDAEGLALDGGELRIDQVPGAARFVPDFADPMVHERRRIEVRREAAAGARRHAASAQERAQQDREMAAVADEARLRSPGLA